MRLFLLDANVLITANDDYYPIKHIPRFWSWLIDRAKQGRIKVPVEIMAEIKAGNVNRMKETEEDDLIRWLRSDNNEKDLLLDASPDKTLVQRVYTEGYGEASPTLEDLKKIMNDALLIAYALKFPGAAIVTLEDPQSNATESKKPRNRSIPFVCRRLNIRCINTYQLIRELDLRIS